MKMKVRLIFILLILLLAGTTGKAGAELLPDNTVFQLQFQKSLFVSGEKIWFKNTIASGHQTGHQTILYADLCGEGTVVSSCIVQRENNHWQSDLTIPDSLETGIYLFRAYTGNNNGKPEVITKLVPVINRFGNNKTNEARKQEPGYKPFNLANTLPVAVGNALKVYASSVAYSTQSPVDFWIESDLKNDASGISLSVFKTDEHLTAQALESHPEQQVVSGQNMVRIFNNLTLSGKVVDKETREAVAGETVLFSIPDTIPDINYALTDSLGEFIFSVADYYGRQDVIVQTLSKDRALDIILYPNLLEAPVIIPFYLPAEVEESEFAGLAVKCAMLAKAYSRDEEEISVKASFKYPFYGLTQNVTIPADYVDLDDFEEISKELLPLCKVRKENGKPRLKIYDPDSYVTYESPWIIVDGVPVFDIAPLLPLNSPAISKIETQSGIRCYGRLYIEGALAVYTKQGRYNGLSLPFNAVRKTFDTFHYQHKYFNCDKNPSGYLPDFRDVLYWSPTIGGSEKVYRQKIQTSCDKGSYVAVAEALDENGNLHRSVFKFEVK